MALSTTEAIIFVIFVVVMSFVTAWIVRRLDRGITRRREERSATRVGRYGTASEKVVKKS